MAKKYLVKCDSSKTLFWLKFLPKNLSKEITNFKNRQKNYNKVKKNAFYISG